MLFRFGNTLTILKTKLQTILNLFKTVDGENFKTSDGEFLVVKD